jgi:UDP-N-acetylglucosamine enolpyruvyl transferase
LNTGSVVLGIISSTAIFFFITNAGCWYGNPIYTQDIRGFIASILAGIPFVKGTIVSNVVYTVALFGGYYALQNKFAVLRTSQIKYS